MREGGRAPGTQRARLGARKRRQENHAFLDCQELHGRNRILQQGRRAWLKTKDITLTFTSKVIAI